ncbi:MAG TPA: CHASE3 domain-containing protein [Terriglobales bacterium]|jgi:PAS domain S-box-containing protein|nr:CHASE3 domain-containing protein [Terriglobales bacterium]
MDQRSFQRLLRRTVALPVVLLVLLAATLVVEILLLSVSLRWVDHSDQVISTARQLQRQIIQMETGLRGYYLTGDQSFLDSYNDAKSKVPEQVENLLSLTSDNPSQQHRLKEVREVNDRWMQWADAQMRQGHQNPPSPSDLLIGQQVMSEGRQRQREFVAAEEALRNRRSAQTKALNDTIVGSAVGLSLLIAFLLFTLTRRELLALSSTYERHLQAEEKQKQQLKESREWLQITLKSLGEAVVSTDKGGKVSFINPAAQRLTGWDETAAAGHLFSEVVSLSDERTRLQVDDPIQAVRRAQHVVGFSNSLMLTSRAGKEYPVELTGAPILAGSGQLLGVVVVFRDVTQRRQTEQTLRSSERMNLAGRLSATIAHEIRNPLDTVSNLIHLLQHHQKPDPTSAGYLQMASEEVARIAQITSQLLTFHREARSPVQVNLTDVLESVLVVFAPQIKQNHIIVERRFDAIHSVRGFPGELRQVFSNLVGNAVEAMSGGGRLILHTRNSSLASEPLRKGVRVTILDDGPGIPAAVRRNLFAPFYTTKGEKGTGLGLWVSRGILEKHEGTIHLSSVIGCKRKGTAFSVFLPFEQRLGMLDVKPAPPAS